MSAINSEEKKTTRSNRQCGEANSKDACFRERRRDGIAVIPHLDYLSFRGNKDRNITLNRWQEIISANQTKQLTDQSINATSGDGVQKSESIKMDGFRWSPVRVNCKRNMLTALPFIFECVVSVVLFSTDPVLGFVWVSQFLSIKYLI